MKTVNILLILLVSFLLVSSFPQRAFCFSSGYERYTTDLFEVYAEYFPIVPVDLSNPTASEEFAIKFQIRQNDYWDYVIHYVPSAFGVHVFFWDECGSSDWPTWKRWYPTSTEQSGLIASWTLSTGAGNLGISASIATAAIHHYNTNYTKYSADHEGKTYIHIGSLEVYYDCWPWWGQVYAEGAGSLGIPNDVAVNHNGHHVQIAIQFILGWTGFFTTWPVATSIGACYFIVGDDIPADTDCWITVQPGKTNFAIKYPQSSGGGGGGCPYIYTWDGQQYVVDNNLLPASELSDGADVEDYYRLERPLVPIYEGRTYSLYSMQIREFEYEHDFIDKVQLLAVDHPADVNIAVTQDGEILTYKSPFPPLSCLDNNGVSRLGEISKTDGDISDPATYFEGYPGDYLILNFGKIVSDNAKLILRTDMKKEFECIEVQVQTSSGMWQTVEVLIPRNYWSIQAVDLSPYVDGNKDLVVRLFWKYHHRLDYVGLDTTPQDSIKINEAHLISAVHSTQGNVKYLLTENDQTYAELTPGQQILLTFLLPNNRNEERTFILYTEGHYITIET